MRAQPRAARTRSRRLADGAQDRRVIRTRMRRFGRPNASHPARRQPDELQDGVAVLIFENRRQLIGFCVTAGAASL